MKQRTNEEWRQAGVGIGDGVDLSRIASDATIRAGCRIQGSETSIAPGCEIGAEAPVVIENCQLGRNVKLKGGYFAGAVFFEGACMGSGAHVRAGTILEEEANGAHTVGLKQTILLPFVTLGSLINFCDILMAGGTSRKDHSEVGSSYIHFNYTPHQDKATASLVGDVPRGVFLDKKPIFLGGQGGLVGPARIAYGSVVAAGGVCRKDMLEENQLQIPSSPKAGTRPYETGVYHGIGRIVENNLIYIGNIMALREWYRNVRSHFLRDSFDLAVLDGGIRNLNLVLAERIKRLGDLAGKMEYSFQWLEANGGPAKTIEMQKRFHAEWPGIKLQIESLESKPSGEFIQALENRSQKESYTETIQSLEPATREAGRVWLQLIVNTTEQLWR
ncbi:MAG: UDP-N-acetylglucosamine pyrophosphorylase [Verrucomicrobiota bacterium]|nr:UDP-N-acetylglucosamine pyrophosphorylase [Verrucomicrobiota bacterium]